MKVSDHQYGPGVKGQGQIYLISHEIFFYLLTEAKLLLMGYVDESTKMTFGLI